MSLDHPGGSLLESFSSPLFFPPRPNSPESLSKSSILRSPFSTIRYLRPHPSKIASSPHPCRPASTADSPSNPDPQSPHRPRESRFAAPSPPAEVPPQSQASRNPPAPDSSVQAPASTHLPVLPLALWGLDPRFVMSLQNSFPSPAPHPAPPSSPPSSQR